jgi:hypothetical protein
VFLVFRPSEYLSFKKQILFQDDTCSPREGGVTECLFVPRLVFHDREVPVVQISALGLGHAIWIYLATGIVDLSSGPFILSLNGCLQFSLLLPGS